MMHDTPFDTTVPLPATSTSDTSTYSIARNGFYSDQQQTRHHQQQQETTQNEQPSQFNASTFFNEVDTIIADPEFFTNAEALEVFQEFAYGGVIAPEPEESRIPSTAVSNFAFEPLCSAPDIDRQHPTHFPPTCPSGGQTKEILTRTSSLISLSPVPDAVDSSFTSSDASIVTASPRSHSSIAVVSDVDSFNYGDFGDYNPMADDRDGRPSPGAHNDSFSYAAPSSIGGGGTGSGAGAPDQRFKKFHEEKWDQKLTELLHFRQQNGHTLVPHTYDPNPQLARWVKRQRRQYKLLQSGKPSTMTMDRVAILEDAGFVWDSHEVSWREKLQELILYRQKNGNCLVPSSYKKNSQLATWVKCQRRQYKLFCDGKPSGMTASRIEQLNAIDFCWEIRPNTDSQGASTAVAAAAASASPSSARGGNRNGSSSKRGKRKSPIKKRDSLDLLGEAAAML